MRPSGRAADELRTVALEIDVNKHAEGSCMVRFGDTQVLCTASIEETVPRWLRGSGKGWITAEYGMLPRATTTRTEREAARGKQSGRTLEIQRLIGRSLRAVADLKGFGEHLIKIDCDVIQADGGTRTAAVTGSYLALDLAFRQIEGNAQIPDRQQFLAHVRASIAEGGGVTPSAWKLLRVVPVISTPCAAAAAMASPASRAKLSSAESIRIWPPGPEILNCIQPPRLSLRVE